MEFNITYKREMKHNYLIIEPLDEFRLGYECKMLLCNSIDGLLKFHLKQLDGKQQYYYEITSRQPLSRLLEKQCITSEEIRLLLVHISQTLNQMESYLLKEEQILLDPDYIYVEPESFFVSLCLIPGRICSFPDDLGKLLQFILSKVNHQDKDSVVLAYSLFQESQKENYGIEDLLKLLTGERYVNNGLETDNSRKFSNGLDKNDEPEETESENGNIRRRKKTEKSNRNAENVTNSHNSIRSQNTCNTRNDGNSKNDSNIWEAPKESKLNRSDVNKKSTDGPVDKSGSQEQADSLHKKRKSTGELSILLILLMILLPSGIWFLYGNQGINMFLMWIIGAEILMAVMLVAALAGCFFGTDSVIKVMERKNRPETPQSSWQMIFQDDLDEEYESAIKSEGGKKIMSAETIESGDGNTVLLADFGINENTHRLISLDGKGQEIVLSYFPFIIGKQEGIADFVLAKETVSRLHVRIDEEEGIFRITDLNSTNGTKVGDRLLENNESAYVTPGQEIYLADQGFRFL